MVPVSLIIFVLMMFSYSEAQLVTLPPPDEYVESFKNHPNWNLLPHELDCGRDISRATYHDDDPDPNPFDDPPPDSRKRVFGGESTDRWEIPWMVAFFDSETDLNLGFVNCGGSIISRKYILTAGHCCVGEMKKEEPGDAFIQVGGHNRSHMNSQCKLPGKTEADVQTCNLMPRNYRVESTIIHPTVFSQHFSSTNKVNVTLTPYDDICLVRVRQKIDFDDRVRPVCLPTYKRIYNSEFVGEKLMLAGWGVGGKVSTQRPPVCPSCVTQRILQKAWLPIVQRSECRRMKPFMNITDNHYCMGGAVKDKPGEIRNGCRGDSGGPAIKPINIHRGHQWSPKGTETFFVFGIMSYSIAHWNPSQKIMYCGLDDPSVFTRVAPYIPWILDNLLEDDILDKDNKGDPRFTHRPTTG